MKIIWNDARKKCNITDSSFEDIIEKMRNDIVKNGLRRMK